MGQLLDAQVFVQVVDSGSIRAAALALGVPKSTVARRVTQLEAELGVRLLDRNTRQARITDAGKRYYDEAAAAVIALERAASAATELQAQPRGTLRLAMPAQLALAFVPQLMRPFLDQYPELRVVIELEDRAVDLVREGVDVLLRTTPGLLRDSTLVSLKLSESALRLYASPGYLATRGTPRRVDELASHDCLVAATRGRTHWGLTDGKQHHELQVNGKVGVHSDVVLRDLAIAGLGIALLSESTCREAVRRGVLAAILPRWSGGTETLHVLHAGGPYVPTKVRVFVDFVRRQLTAVRGARGAVR